MKLVDCLEWMLTNGYPMVVWPTEMIYDCVIPSRYERTSDVLERVASAPMPDAQRDYFIEVGRNLAGHVAAWVYAYPRPAALDTDVAFSLTPGTSVLPSERAWIDTPERYLAPFLCIGMRRDA